MTSETNSTMYYDRHAVQDKLSLNHLNDLLEDSLKRYSSNDKTLKQPLRSSMPIGDGNENILLNMPCVDLKRGYLALKTLTLYPNCSPSLDGTVSLFNSNNGQLLLAIILSKLKTEPVLAILGCGTQGYSHLKVFTQLFKWKKIYLWNRHIEKAERLKNDYSAELNTIEVLNDLDDERLKEADVVCTTTASEEPLLSVQRIKLGGHINAVGSFRLTMRELDDNLMLNSTIIVDSKESAAKEAGDIVQSKATITAEIGEVLKFPTLLDDQKSSYTVFKSLGLAIEDLAAAIVLHESR
ncbi:unnamed protein product [Didymodactylos carnosus]|uniref:Ketimine reductase mu-crystallin n=1 Tax=Didymodactylos carnosus TaxID=1234261 RepID=A0A813Y110_9BILA|nr:unnamed protein product [Didymodactylos carnosus]CAF0878983.1 unnamed protein product [Didymodactylos carnosus]CAF3493993.1 unnamed protein product [Didymodactylos carnosus]CAF3665499.1 unnamed protein product [Didymodactylos carnosus]